MKSMHKTKPGCISRVQADTLREVLKIGGDDPSLLCDLEGCGPVEELEKAFKRLCGTRFALAVSSGTAAIHAALLALGIGNGDEVIVTPYSWIQSVAPVLFTGAVPVFADIDPETLNLDPASVASRLSPRTRAILPVHLFGHVADMVRLGEIAEEAGIALISDAAHALGARLHGRPAGSWGHIACFSLGRGKIVSGGEGGILTTDDESVFERALQLTQHPERVKRFREPEKQREGMGLNLRIHPLAALLAVCETNTIDGKQKHREEVLQGFWDGLGKESSFTAPTSLSGEAPVAYGIPITFRGEGSRESLVSRVQGLGIPFRCGPVSKPLHLRLNESVCPQPAFHNTHREGSCPVAEERCRDQEIWALSALDMDGITGEQAQQMGIMVRAETEKVITD